MQAKFLYVAKYEERIFDFSFLDHLPQVTALDQELVDVLLHG